MAKNIESEEEKKNREMVEDIATNVAKLSRQISELLNGRLKRKAILILLAASTGLPKSHIDAVLNAISDMEKDYLNR